MKKVILLALLMPYMAFGQIVENFESGNIANWVQSSEGRWKADTTGSISGTYSLHHVFDNPDAGTDRIGIPVMNLHPSLGLTRWSFQIRHGYDPSSSNNWSVFLMSDAEPSAMSTDGGTNGFVLGVNLTGYDDTLHLWKVKRNIVTTVIDCRINWQTTIGITGAVKIIVERSQEGNWTVSVYRLNENLIGTSSGTDNEIFSPSWFGIYYKYSSTRDRLLWLDDISIEGNFFEDNEAPVVTGCEASGKNSVEVTFNEEPGTEFLVPDNFSLNAGENKSISVIKVNSLTYLVESANALNNKSINNLIISRICDNSGNCAQNIQVPFTPVWAETGDVVISEIMADPLPEVSLPGKEYIEIMNRTEFPFNLKNWKLSSESQSVFFPQTTIQPSEIIIVCSLQDTSFFTDYGRVLGLVQFPSLTDGGKILCLSDSSGFLIHGVEYSSDWYGDKLKSGGGWSLEMIDTRFPFYDEGNWIASTSRKGGTPGYINAVSSVNPDISFYGVHNVFPDDSINITVRFTEPVLSLPGNINSIKIGGKDIIDLYPTDPLFRQFSIKVEDPLHREEVYQLDISGDIKDFAGNGIQKGKFDFGLPEPSESGDILFNELLFNPLPEDPDYIELFNCSEKVIDASRLQLVSVNDGTGDTSQVSPVSGEKRCIMPGTYYALTTDRKRISERYFSTDHEYLFEEGSLPSMADDQGHLILYNRELDRIDEVFYNEEMHDSLLSGYEGVALEKIMPRNRSEDAINWHSASESSGWGTPGAPNFFEDHEAPVVTGCEASGKNSVEVTFNEESGTELLVPGNFSLNAGENKSISVIKKNNLTYLVEFANALNNKSINNLIISRICDNSGNCAQNIQVPFTPLWAETGDVVISEIMADPLPEVSLPRKEYLEIINRTGYSFNLKNWKLSSEGQDALFPETTIQPSGIMIICSSQDTSFFTNYGKVIGLKQFPSLTDGGKILCLSDSTGFLIHGVEYSYDWYRDELKAKGGWSLEMIDTRFPFFDKGNWIASTSRKGGTPGFINAVSSGNPDISFYGVHNVFPDDSNNITVKFTEPVLSLPGNINSIKIGGKDIIDLYPTDPLFREYSIKVADPLRKREVYQFEISGDIKDFAGNGIQKGNYSFGLPEPPEPGDIMFNELLFNPLPGDPDYIELYNCSEKIIDASRLQLVSVNDGTGDTSQVFPVSGEKRCIMPGTYYTLTTDRKRISERYFSTDPEYLFEEGSLPSMADDQGHMILYNRELDRIDEVFYNEDMHYSLLTVYEGVALEKTRPQNRSEEAINWHSASESSGWGTPGAPNSVFIELPVTSDKVAFSSSKITPDNDGNEDFLVIRLSLSGNGNVVSVMIFDETGNYVRKVVANMLAGPEASLIWDGTADDGSPVDTGVYIVFITLYDNTGKTDKWKKVCTVIRN